MIPIVFDLTDSKSRWLSPQQLNRRKAVILNQQFQASFTRNYLSNLPDMVTSSTPSVKPMHIYTPGITQLYTEEPPT